MVDLATCPLKLPISSPIQSGETLPRMHIFADGKIHTTAPVAGVADGGNNTKSFWSLQMSSAEDLEGLRLVGSGISTTGVVSNKSIQMWVDYLQQPICWVVPDGGFNIADDVKEKWGVFPSSEIVSFRRWDDLGLDQVTPTPNLGAPGGLAFDWPGLWQGVTPLGAGTAAPIPGAPDYWISQLVRDGPVSTGQPSGTYVRVAVPAWKTGPLPTAIPPGSAAGA